MRNWLVLLDMGGGLRIPLRLKAKETTHALTKAAIWCQTENYHPVGMESIVLTDYGIIDVDET